ncbi:type IV toxin-antitoxin system AbiEi family antitoxin domain-containing protein [Propionicicella superfundia]|uniref:type IV toxin-antitoxin system AbiEi family antitoxin domain-containing protein n=1 Tax=Propionicicella superfundia TaxID=348582 RepID=UPI0003FBE274|nr:type IV toxin-antitoxin system AbiEi family antitoxin domain-containing protein [Propionicicella superfundia]
MRIPQPFAPPAVPTRRRDLVALGLTQRRIGTAVAGGRLVRVRQGVYLDPARWPVGEAEQHLVRAHAEQVYRPDGAVSHRAAALYWELPLLRTDWADEPVWITLPAGRGFRSSRSRRLEQSTAPLPPHHVTLTESGARITTVARTAADVAGGMESPSALMVLDAALRRQCRDLMSGPRRRDLRNPRLVAAAKAPLLEAMDRPRMRPGKHWLTYADPLRESAIESLSYGHMALAGLPLPACQFPLTTPAGVLYPDFYWEEQCLIGEADGRVKYADADAMLQEKEREQVLRDLGFRFVRWLGKEIHLWPGTVMDRIARALNA